MFRNRWRCQVCCDAGSVEKTPDEIGWTPAIYAPKAWWNPDLGEYHQFSPEQREVVLLRCPCNSAHALLRERRFP